MVYDILFFEKVKSDVKYGFIIEKFVEEQEEKKNSS